MNTKFLYDTEILLLTKNYHQEELYCWLNWHINILHFDHVVIFDNESPIDIGSILSKFPKDKIEYYLIKGWPNQYKLYNDYLKEPKSHWTIALDDDEYLYLSDVYGSDIHSFIKSMREIYKDINKFYILWTHLFSQEPIQEYSDLFINTHIFYSYYASSKIMPSFGMDNTIGKCFINNEFSYIYENSHISYGHIPKCLNGDNTTILVRTGDIVEREEIHIKENFSLYPDAFIAHYQFKNKKDWITKCYSPIATNESFSIICKKNSYDMLYSFKSSFQKFDLLKNKYHKFVS